MSDWQPIEAACVDGVPCSLRFRDGMGEYEAPGPWVLHDDGEWYLIDPPTPAGGTPIAWRVYKETAE